MKLDVIFDPVGLPTSEVAGRVVFVVDVLRATTVMCTALHQGARGIVPVSSTEEAMRVAQALGTEDVLLSGERNGLPIPGFALGNSPLEMTEGVVKGKSLVMTTTNGTKALLATQGAAEVYIAAAVNVSVAGVRARELLELNEDLVILCSGREGNFGLDDAYTAGRLAVLALGGRRIRKGLNDAALVAVDLVRRYGNRWERPLSLSAAGRHLRAIGFSSDVLYAAHEDQHPVLPVYRDRRITLSPLP